MTDTQWPRFQVFMQERAGEPFLDVGSVHAPDVELALLNARDVFLRRPDGINLWVIPADAIFSRTEQEIQDQGLRGNEPAKLIEQQPSGDEPADGANSAGEPSPPTLKGSEANGPAVNEANGAGVQPGRLEKYYVFQKARAAGTQTMVGELQAASAEAALRMALQAFSPGRPPFAWWVFPARLALSTGPEDFDSMFAPAGDKHFRLPGDYHIQTAMRRIKEQNE